MYWVCEVWGATMSCYERVSPVVRKCLLIKKNGVHSRTWLCCLTTQNIVQVKQYKTVKNHYPYPNCLNHYNFKSKALISSSFGAPWWLWAPSRFIWVIRILRKNYSSIKHVRCAYVYTCEPAGVRQCLKALNGGQSERISSRHTHK